MRSRPLEDNILAAFKEAYDAERMDVAQHLLCALEALETQALRGNALGRAYLLLGSGGGRRKPQQQA